MPSKSKRRREHDKLTQAWFDLNRANHAAQDAARQRASQSRLVQETDGTQLLYHKVQSHTIAGPGRVTMQTDYACSQDDSIPTSLQVPSQIQEPEFSFDDNFDTAEYTIYDEHIADTTGEPAKQNRTVGVSCLKYSLSYCTNTACQDNPLSVWVRERENFLLELLRLDGRGDFIFDQVCEGHDGCQGHPDYRCRDCFGTALYCKGCMLARHQESPLHRLQVCLFVQSCDFIA